MKKSGKNYSKLAKLFLIISIFIIIIVSIMFFSVYFSAKLDKNAIISPKAEITLVDNNGKTIENKRLYKYVRYEDISPNIVNAFVALEDKRFYSHRGVDYYRTAGALIQDIKTASFKEGGSTITQQLAKNTQLSGEKTLKRKIKELRLARIIEKNYTKEQIMEMYLNAIYFGSGVYGIDSACKNYFGKSPAELTPSEGAILAGIVKNPSNYSPKNNPSASVERRNLVLRLMKEQNYIDEYTYERSIKENYETPKDISDGQICTPYFNNAISEAAKLLGVTEKQLISSKYVIHTYYSPELQQTICSSMTANGYRAVNSSGNEASRYALLADNESGGVSAYYSDDEINVFLFRRQPGSAIKPIIAYAPALEYGLITTKTPVLDEKIDINGYSPKNYGGNYSGWITAESAMAKSVNTVAVKLFDELGSKNCFDFATKCGLRFSDNDGTAAALGGLTDGSTAIELSEAYMTLASGGQHKINSFIKKIEDSNGKLLYEHKRNTTKAMSQDTAFLTTTMLENTVKNGTASKLNGFSYAIASKTGTTQSIKCDKNLDAWNVSYTTEHTLTVWYGDGKNTAETAIETTGSGYPTLMARKIYSLLPAPAKKDFDIPSSVYKMEIDGFALEKDHELYLSNGFTPEIYKVNSYFSLKNCPLTCSPYFDINNITFNVFNSGESRTAEIVADEPYSYILEEYDMLGGIKNEYTFTESGSYTLLPPSENAIYSYRLGVYFNGKLLGYTSNSQKQGFNFYNAPLRRRLSRLV